MVEPARPAPASDPERLGSERLGFHVGGALYALPAAEVVEVLRPRPLVRVPHAPPGLLGVANLRGTILPVVSAARLLGADQSADTVRASRVLVLDHRPPCGLLVDAVSGLIHEAAQPFDAAALLATTIRRDASAPRRATAGVASSEIVSPVVASPVVAGEAALAVLGFAVAGRSYALPLDSVIEVMPMPRDFGSVAGSDPAVLGVVAHRDRLLPVVALARLLGHGDGAGTASLVVVAMAGGDVALAVDEVRAIMRLPRDRIDAVPSVLTRGSGETRIEGIARCEDGMLVAILSRDRLFDEATQRRLADRAGQRETLEADGPMEEAREQFVVLTMGGERYGLPIASVEEVVRRPDDLSPLPRSPSFVLGVMNLRGQAVPVLDGRRRFGTADGAAAGRRVVVVSLNGLRAGFAVDDVSEIIAVPASAITPAPEFARPEGTDGHAFRRIAEHGGRLVFLVEPDELLAEAERDALAAAADGRGGRAKGRKRAGAAP